MARVILYPFQVEEVLHFRGSQENVEIFHFGIGTVLRQLALETFSCLLDKIVQQPFQSFHFKVFRVNTCTMLLLAFGQLSLAFGIL